MFIFKAEYYMFYQKARAYIKKQKKICHLLFPPCDLDGLAEGSIRPTSAVKGTEHSHEFN